MVTNNHVIGDANDIQVILHDGTKLKAEIVGKDSKIDLAVLRVKPRPIIRSRRCRSATPTRCGRATG